MACHGVISAGFGRNRFCIKLEITPPSNSYHFRYRTFVESEVEKWAGVIKAANIKPE